MRKSLISCVAIVAATVASGTARADWSDTFTGGQFDQSWTMVDEAGNFATPAAGSGNTATGTYTLDVSNDYLAMDDIDATPGAPNFVVGWVTESFTDVRVSGVLNPGNSGGNNDLGLIARADILSGNAYIATVDFGTGSINISKFLGGSLGGIGTSGNVTGFDGTSSYYAEFTVASSGTVALLVEIWDSAAKNTLLGTASASDSVSSFSSGNSGFVSAVNGDVAPTPVMAHLDSLNSVLIPEPATISLIGLGALAIGRRRRQA
jgi:hypothetical protein